MGTSRDRHNVPWPIAVSLLLRNLSESFTLSQIYDLSDPLRKAFPNNNNVEAKIRQSLQVLRDRGELAFEGDGHYRKLLAETARTVHVDFAEAARYVSRSQVARIAVETWAARNVLCYRCDSPLALVPPNTQLIDALCFNKSHEVQIKAFAGVSKDNIVGAAYAPIKRRLADGVMPDYLLISYDRPREVVLLAEYIDGSSISPDRVVARKPLGSTARRAGWVGATLSLEGLPRHVVVGPGFTNRFSQSTPSTGE